MLEIEDQTEDSPGGLSLRGLGIAAGVTLLFVAGAALLYRVNEIEGQHVAEAVEASA